MSAIPEITFFDATVDLDGNHLAITSGFANSIYLFERQDQELGASTIYLFTAEC